jgi:hypothetical protein
MSFVPHVPGDDTAAHSTIMSPDHCEYVASSWELPQEAVALMVCFALGFVSLQALKKARRPLHMKSVPLASPRATGKPVLEGLAGLPREITAEVSRCLPLKDFAVVSATSHATWQRFGVSPEAWFLLAADHQIELPHEPHKANEVINTKLANNPLVSDVIGWESREAFRRGLFHIGGQQLVKLGSLAPGVDGTGHVAVLRESAHVVLGLMPSDGAATVEFICSIAERALQAHNPADKDAAHAASAFLHAARRRRNVVDADQAERVEGAYSSALQLQALMDVAMDESLEDVDMLSERSAAVRDVEILSDPSEDMHEAQRHCELDAMLEELRRQTEPQVLY